MVRLRQDSIQDMMNKLCLVEAELMENKSAFHNLNICTHSFCSNGVCIQLVLPHYSRQTICLP